MNIEITLETLPAFLRGEGFEQAADLLAAGDWRQGFDQLGRIMVALELMPNQGEAVEVVERMADTLIGGLANAATLQLVPVLGIAEALGVTREAVYRWLKEYEDFPKPIEGLGRRRLWDLDEVRVWVEARDFGPGGRPRKLGGE